MTIKYSLSISVICFWIHLFINHKGIFCMLWGRTGTVKYYLSHLSYWIILKFINCCIFKWGIRICQILCKSICISALSQILIGLIHTGFYVVGLELNKIVKPLIIRWKGHWLNLFKVFYIFLFKFSKFRRNSV